MSQMKTIFDQHKKYGLFIRDCFTLIFFWKTTLSHGKLNKESSKIVFQLI